MRIKKQFLFSLFSKRIIHPYISLNMRHSTFFLAVFSFLTLCSVSADREISFAERQVFIENYTEIAVKEMHRTGVPASITLAQFILESDWGRGELFVNANAGFGVKCKNTWTGDTYYLKDDDYKNQQLIESCFRKYPSVEATFKDHSDFLKNRVYYKKLFLLERNDYKGWAYGLKECKYATDPKYPTKLIRLIETYRLNIYDYEVENTPVDVQTVVITEPTIPAKVVRPTAIIPVAQPIKSQITTQPTVPAYTGVQYPVKNTAVVPAKVTKPRRVAYKIKPRHRKPVASYRP